jgi:hypothetical protein
MADNNAAHLVLGHSTVHDQAEAEKHPRQIRRFENQQAQETKQRVWVLPAPDVYERATQRGPEKGHGEHGRYAQQKGRGEGEQPREVGRRASRRLFEKARVALEDEDVVEKVEAQWAKVKEGGDQAPVLLLCELPGRWHGAWGETNLALEEDGTDAVEELEGRDDVALDQHARAQRCRHPPACAYRHLVEPLLEREAAAHHAVPAAQNVCHGGPAGGRRARRGVAMAGAEGCGVLGVRC